MGRKIEPYKGISVIYDEIRPSYPEELIQDVITKTDLKQSDRLLEIGSGTGKATIQFAEKGFAVHGIEIGEDMAEIFKHKCADYPKVSIDVVPFEEWISSSNQKYDMIYSAQSFHWLDPGVKYKKCYELLKDKGYLILFWYKPIDANLPLKKEIEEKVEKIVEKYTSNYSFDKSKPERRKHDGVSNDDERKAEIEASGLFTLIEKIEYTYEIKDNAEQYLKAQKTVPAFASILDMLDDRIIEKMDEEIKEIINSYGGYVGTMFKYSLYIAKKIS